MAIVSIKSQQVTFYDADGWICALRCRPASRDARRRPASSRSSRRTWTTARPFMTMPRCRHAAHTWNGIALHGGPLPGYAASHGCVRMPYGFAEKLFDKTRIGMRVIISPNDAAPVEISHSALFLPDAEAVAAAPARSRDASPRGGRGHQSSRPGEESRCDSGARGGIAQRRAAQAEGSNALPTPNSRPRRKRSPPQRRTSQGTGRGAEAEGRRQGRQSWRRSSTPPRPTQSRSSTPRPLQRLPPRRPKRGG